MKRLLLCVPLLVLAPLGDFLSFYAEGVGVLSYGNSFLIGIFSLFVLPWIISAVIASVAKFKWPIRTLLFVGALILQPVLIFRCLPPGYTVQMMGLAHKLRREFSTDQLRACADQIRQKQHDGTLVTRGEDKEHLNSIYGDGSGVIIDDSQLPASLRGRFVCVQIVRDPDSGDKSVMFMFDRHTGIICDDRKYVSGLTECSMADGVHAYHTQRGW